MRTIKELLEIVLKEVEEAGEIKGLCNFIILLEEKEIINFKEGVKLDVYIKINLLTVFNLGWRYFKDKLNGCKVENTRNLIGYVFPIGEKKQRINWLKEQIKKHS
jgi:hypothetical protein